MILSTFLSLDVTIYTERINMVMDKLFGCMGKRLSILAVLLLLLLPMPLLGQNMSTIGNDYWLCFLNNNSTLYTGTKHRIFVSSANNCSVTVSNPRTGWSTTQNVTVGAVTTIEVPMEQCENTQSEVVVDKGIHVTSTGMISVYSSTLSTATYEAANILPTSTLRDDYVLLTYPADRYGCVFAIVATEDNTTVDIVLTSPTYNGASAGDTLTVNLQYAGQVYQVFQQYENSSYPMNNFRDITGTRVHSRNCKPIAVFNGDVCVYIPYFITGQTCDLVYEQCIPPEYWGRKYIVPFLPFNSYDGHPNYVRVTALYDSTLVTRNNGESVLVNAGESYDFQIIRNNTTVADVVDASLPVSVNLYFASSDNTNGDPSMLNISPIEQRVDNVTFVCRSTQNTQNHKVNVILRTDERHLFRLDGSAHSDEFSVVTEDITYSSAIFNLSAGSHTMSMNGGSGFVGHVFGIGRRESYAYSVGSRLYSMTNTLYVNDVQVRQSDTVMGCKGDTLAFKVKHDSNINYVVWNIDGTFLVGDSVNYTFPTLGTREVVAYLSRTEPTCFSTDDTLRTFVNIHGQDTTMMDTAVCNFPFVWFGNQYTESDTLEHHLQNTFGCDSLLLLNIELTDEGKDTTILDTVVCNLPFIWFDNQYTESDTLEHHLLNAIGCDSLLLMNLVVGENDTVRIRVDGCDSANCFDNYYYNDTLAVANLMSNAGCDSVVFADVYIHPSYYLIARETINQYDTLVWIDGDSYWSEEQHPEVVLRSRYGCDSTLRLSLTVIPYEPPAEQDSSSIWVPNCFTPDEETNSQFKVFGNDIIEMRVFIFNRWGLIVTECDGLTEGWDGTYKGEKCKQETYVYLIEYRIKAMPAVIQKKVGTVLLLR